MVLVFEIASGTAKVGCAGKLEMPRGNTRPVNQSQGKQGRNTAKQQKKDV